MERDKKTAYAPQTKYKLKNQQTQEQLKNITKQLPIGSNSKPKV
jgi:hypothetical protein